MIFKILVVYFSSILIANHAFSADTANCPLKDMFAADIYALASQVAIICSDSESEVFGKIAAKDIALECHKKGLSKGVVFSNGKPMSMDKTKLEFSDVAGDFCSNNKGYKKELQTRIDLLESENNKLKQRERIALRNIKADQAMMTRKKEDEAYWESPAGKIEMAKRKVSTDKVIAMYLENKNRKPAVVQDKMSILKSQLRKCGVNSETAVLTSIDQQCKRSLAQDKYEDAVSFCSINYSSCFSDL